MYSHTSDFYIYWNIKISTFIPFRRAILITKISLFINPKFYSNIISIWRARLYSPYHIWFTYNYFGIVCKKIIPWLNVAYEVYFCVVLLNNLYDGPITLYQVFLVMLFCITSYSLDFTARKHQLKCWYWGPEVEGCWLLLLLIDFFYYQHLWPVENPG